jgi:hypothetical protein
MKTILVFREFGREDICTIETNVIPQIGNTFYCTDNKTRNIYHGKVCSLTYEYRLSSVYVIAYCQRL